ncbi:hypothetical protein BDK51DRAFT_31075 [Blyttiomyces helicus]|uniref:Uncharacterized protein n=1 Tax=Blyttiomyces helicus TaxID=388810 RepID=A0A4P9WPI2_9FUNG|nr:hypothetical protein BDK51DRAFT_31075 [Blyttiomyces helicus]|eukprot:RKO94235.1 hypothetical protein BDK51DRAFT_31075 [Blyttiomyces helicus]
MMDLHRQNPHHSYPNLSNLLLSDGMSEVAKVSMEVEVSILFTPKARFEVDHNGRMVEPKPAPLLVGELSGSISVCAATSRFAMYEDQASLTARWFEFLKQGDLSDIESTVFGLIIWHVFEIFGYRQVPSKPSQIRDQEPYQQHPAPSQRLPFDSPPSQYKTLILVVGFTREEEENKGQTAPSCIPQRDKEKEEDIKMDEEGVEVKVKVTGEDGKEWEALALLTVLSPFPSPPPSPLTSLFPSPTSRHLPPSPNSPLSCQRVYRGHPTNLEEKVSGKEHHLS